jgi:DNA polymerase III subunit epsilon
MTVHKIAVIDLETTGRRWSTDRIVEVGIVVISPEGEVLSEYETLVNPRRDLGPFQIHRISSADILKAPTFGDIAGDVLEILSESTVIAGHNVRSFDSLFLASEYKRLSITLPEVPLFDTFRLFPNTSLQACCDNLGIPFDGQQHRAICDARATAGIVSSLRAGDPSILDGYRLDHVSWPTMIPRHTPCYCREHAQLAYQQPPSFLKRIAERVRHDPKASPPNVFPYLELLHHVLEDRVINEVDGKDLEEAAVERGLSAPQVNKIHEDYLQRLAVQAVLAGVGTDCERRDLHLVANLLGQNPAVVDAMLDVAAGQFRAADAAPTAEVADLRGHTVCFTGDLQCTINGEHITRDKANALAEQAGLIPVKYVSKKLRILVVADPNSQSGKADKARRYGTRILYEGVFWRMANIRVD